MIRRTIALGKVKIPLFLRIVAEPSCRSFVCLNHSMSTVRLLIMVMMAVAAAECGSPLRITSTFAPQRRRITRTYIEFEVRVILDRRDGKRTPLVSSTVNSLSHIPLHLRRSGQFCSRFVGNKTRKRQSTSVTLMSALATVWYGS